MQLCGCKLSSRAPFCDGVTCERLMKGERINVAPAHILEEGEDVEESEDSEDSADEAADRR